MSKWQADIDSAVSVFLTVAKLARDPIARADIEIEYLPAPHHSASRLPVGKQAVYGFCLKNEWLKIGKAGPLSNARYTSQHYLPNSAGSSLAKSLVTDSDTSRFPNLSLDSPGRWIRESTHRVNILLPAERSPTLLSLLEAFLHSRLKPIYEGNLHAVRNPAGQMDFEREDG